MDAILGLIHLVLNFLLAFLTLIINFFIAGLQLVLHFAQSLVASV